MFDRAMNTLLSVITKFKDPIILENILIYCCGCCYKNFKKFFFRKFSARDKWMIPNVGAFFSVFIYYLTCPRSATALHSLDVNHCILCTATLDKLIIFISYDPWCSGYHFPGTKSKSGSQFVGGLRW